jgi:integrase
LVFPSTSGSFRSGKWIDVQLYKAMARAGVPRIGSTGQPRVFHSFRHTFAKLAMENGAQLTWLQRHMGHESLRVTSDIYGHFGSAARRLEVAKLEGAFNV